MEFAEVDNHDDFYSHEEGRVHVRDQRGVYIIYDASMDDYKFVTPLPMSVAGSNNSYV